MNMNLIRKICLVQRTIPLYRIPFFDMLHRALNNQLYIAAGKPRDDEAITIGEIPNNLNFHHLTNIHLFKNKFYLCWQWGLRSWLKSTSPDLLIIEANPRYISSRGAIKWMQKHNRPVIGWGLGIPNKNKLIRKYRQKFLNNFDALITYSQKGYEEYLSGGFNGDGIFIAKNAISPKPKDSLINKPNKFREKPVIIFVGRLQERKRLDILIKACSNLPSTIQPELWIVGDGPARSNLEVLSKKIYPFTTFFGFYFGEKLEKLFHEADLFVLPGTGGLAVQEAMGYGLPVIVAEGDGTQTNLVRPDNGWLIPTGDVEFLTQILITALSNPLLLRKMGEKSFAIVKNEINLEQMVNSFQSAIQYVFNKEKYN